MAIFTNYATLSYNGGSTNSNTVTGEILETISATKTAVVDEYSANDSVTYVVTLVNSGSVAVTGLSVTDDLGGYTFDGATVYPLAYTAGSIKYYINGVLQAAPTVNAGPPLVISGINIPANSNAMLIYEATTTDYAPLDTQAIITNTVTVTGGGLVTPVTATETINSLDAANLNISKSLTPSVVTENGQLTYTFVIENFGNTQALATDNVVLTDTFDPILTGISVTYNGAPWVETTNYTYDETTGIFSTVLGQITVPAATFTQNADGTWTTTPGITVITVTGTV